jgi:hypothetical protein
MEPNDPQLHELLREWQTPEIPSSLEERVLGARQSWWSFLLHGYVRVPVPVLYCLIGLMIFAGWRMSARSMPSVPSVPSVPCVVNCNHAVAGAC